MISEEEKYRLAKKRVGKKKGFYGHLASYVAVNTVFLIVTYMEGEGFQWVYVMMFWGIGLIMHYLRVFGFPGKDSALSAEWEAREIQKELGKLDRQHGPSVDQDITTPDDELELKEFRKMRKEWDDKDFV